jgi:DnaJ-class molecular chaperone
MAKKGPGFVPCTNCGGSGAVSVTEIYIDGKGKTQTRVVRKICGTCGGSGGFHV